MTSLSVQTNLSPENAVRAFYHAFGQRDRQQLRALLHSDVEWNQCQGYPGGAQRRGIEDVLSGILDTNQSLWEDFQANVQDVVVEGTTVVVLGFYSAIHRHTQHPMYAVFAHVYRLRGDKIIRFDQVVDTAPIIQAMSP